MFRVACLLLMFVSVGVVFGGCCAKKPDSAAAAAVQPAAAPPKPAAPPRGEWKSLFDGKTLGNWTVTEFGGEGEVKVADGAIQLPFGNDMSGVTWKGEPPFRINYELELEAQRIDGSDFFAGITFPVKSDYVSLIMGGWGGGLVGISSFDGMDASENDTSSWQDFENGKWYKIRLRVTPRQIEVWLDDKKLIDKVTEGHRLDTRIEVEMNKPLGIATYQTHGAIRNIRWREVEGPADPAPKD